ncbi:MAG: spore cortex biosynthesis protein YabQ [Clostridia bacterium]|nr:spore cortex biosynthesis protein YabQ [Clostridia bacterium]
MHYMPDFSYQIEGFLYSAGLGFILGMIYDFFRAVFYLFTGNEKRFAIARDLIFTLFCLFLTFIFLLVMCSGKVMLYAISGEIIGGVIYIYTVSNLIFAKIKRIIGKSRRIIIKLSSRTAEIISKISRRVKKTMNFILKK